MTSQTNALIDVYLSINYKHQEPLVIIHHQLRWNVLQPPRATYEYNHKNPISIHVAPRISNFMKPKIKLDLIFIALQLQYYKKTKELWLHFMTIEYQICNVWLRLTSTILSENESIIMGHNDWCSIWSYWTVLVVLDVFPMGFGTSVGTPFGTLD